MLLFLVLKLVKTFNIYICNSKIKKVAKNKYIILANISFYLLCKLIVKY